MAQPAIAQDLGLGVIAVALAVVVRVTVSDYPATASAFPSVLANWLMLPIGLLLVTKGLLRLRFEAKLQPEASDEASQHVQFTPITLATIALVIVSTAAIYFVGFLGALALLILGCGIVFRARPVPYVIFAVLFLAFIWLFLDFFSVQMPEGMLFSE
jgi:xanthine/uracil permease